MTLEELKALWEKAQKDSEAKPEDEGLKAAEVAAKKAYDDAKSKVDPPDPDPEDPDKIDEEKLDAKTKAYLAKLRKENAGHRTKNKELGSKFATSEAQKKAILKAAGLLDEEKPEEKLQAATQQNETLAFRNAVLETAVSHGIPADKLKYFQFLMADAVEGLKDDEELSEEKLAEIVKDCKGSAGKKASSTVRKFDKDGKEIVDPPPGEKGELTFEKFLAMGMIDRSKLYQTHPEQYERFYKEAKAKKKLI